MSVQTTPGRAVLLVAHFVVGLEAYGLSLVSRTDILSAATQSAEAKAR